MNEQPADRVAKYLLAIRQEKDTTPMSIIKLTYICHGWMLGLYERPLISEEVEAWKFGPVIPSIYQKYKKYRSNPISPNTKRPLKYFDEQQESTMNQVEAIYGDVAPWKLSAITHKRGTPWCQIYNGGEGLFKAIPDEMIRDYYMDLAKKSSS